MNLARRARRAVRGRLQERFPRPDPHDQEARTEIVILLRKSIILLTAWMLLVSAGTLWELVDNHSNVQQASSQAHVACVRSRDFAPQLARAYRHYHILTGHALWEYRATIPRSC